MLRNEKIISLAEAYKKMKEGELKGDQKELDLDDDGDIDGSDLKNLRKGKKDKDIGKDKVVINPKDDVEEGCKKSMKEEECPKCKCDPCECDDDCDDDDDDDDDDMEEGSCSKKSMKKESLDLEEAVGTKTAYKIQELLGRLNVLLKPTSVMGKELISTRGAGFKKDLETALNHVKAIRDIVSDIEVELSMNEGKIDDLRDKMRAKKELSRGFDSKEKDKKAPSTRKVAGKSYGGSKSKDDLDESKTEKAYDKSRFGMGDSRSEQEIRDQIKNLDDKTLKIWAKDNKKSFFNSKVRKLQNQLVAQELKRRGLQTESTIDEATKQDPNASDKEVLEPKVEGEKKFKLKHLIKKISDPGSSESK